MSITLTPELEQAVAKEAERRGTTPESLILDTLHALFVSTQESLEARDEWEANLLRAGTDCQVSLSHEALSSEGLYE
ncbi:MAG: hypothetical protein KF893_11500 [Caldilineaceae bacterium]|nr:hypothetical protein [Caldilineaceae bacterium]